MDPLRQRLNSLTGGRVLDVATGFGDFANLLIESFDSTAEVIGIDYSEKRIQTAKEKSRHEQLQFIHMDAEHLEFEDCSFDTVGICNSLHHLANIDTVLTEMKRVLKPGGLFLIGEVYQDRERHVPNGYYHIHHWWAEIDRLEGISHNETLTRAEVIEIASTLGLSDIEQMVITEEPWPPSDREHIDLIADRCEEFARKVEVDPAHADLAARGRRLAETIKQDGCVLDPVVYVLGRKP